MGSLPSDVAPTHPGTAFSFFKATLLLMDHIWRRKGVRDRQRSGILRFDFYVDAFSSQGQQERGAHG